MHYISLITAQEKEYLLKDCPDEGLFELSGIDVYKELRKIKKESHLFLAKSLQNLSTNLLCSSPYSFPLWLISALRPECFSCFGRKHTYVSFRRPKPPKGCDDLRPISLTPCFTKVTESFIFRYLLAQVRESIGKYQYAGLSKCGTFVYLVWMFDRIRKSLETPGCFVDLAVIAFRKAFDLLSHLSACLNLKRMGAKRETLTIVLDFMSGRQQKVYLRRAKFPV